MVYVYFVTLIKFYIITIQFFKIKNKTIDLQVTESLASDTVFPLTFEAIIASLPACSGPAFSINK